ncbi:uncharacterized protein LOC143031784 isoform X2 [Oratosquilla oratoria]|uniref:uncharacterized protein LOC143031784 isoform X2 n=1 Tax=Oratosquilla oratoria TaxID=337810 RepID=UPI003F76522B
MANTPLASSSRDHSSQMSVSDIEASQRSTQVLEDTGQEDDSAGDTMAGDKKLKNMMSGLEQFFVFDRHIRTELSSEGTKKRTIYTGQAKCQQKACKGKTITFSSKSKANLRKHYEKMHKDLVRLLDDTLGVLSKRRRSAHGDNFPSKRSGQQLCMEEALAEQEEVTPEQKREAWNRWFIENMTPLSITDHPSLWGAMGLIASDFSVPSRRTMTNTPSASSSRDHSPSQMSVSDIEASHRSTQGLEDTLQEDDSADDTTAADEKLKKMMSGLQQTELSSEGRKKRTIYTGQAKCQQKACKGKTIIFTSKSKANLRKHYEKMHKDLLRLLDDTLGVLSKRRRSAPGDDFPSKRSGQQLCMEEALAEQEEVTPEQKREAWNRWFIETMTPLSITDHPSLRGAMSLIAPDFSVPSRRTITITPSVSPPRDHSPSEMSVSDIEASQLSTQVLEDSLQEDDSADETTTADKKLKKIMSGLEKFFVFDRHIRTEKSIEGLKERTIYTGQAKCQQKACKGKTIIFSSKSKANLRKHYEKVHKNQVRLLDDTQGGLGKRGCSASGDDFPSKRSGRQLCKEEALPKQEEVTPEQKREAWNRWFIETMTPLSVTDHPSLRGAMGLIAPDFSVPSRRTMTRSLEKMAEKAKLDLSNLLFSVQYVATTADSWTAHSRVFIGMTVHWIDPVNLDRRHGTLACKEIKESQEKSVIAKVISDVHDDFGLSHKLTATTTDNGTNYCAAFSHFGVEDVPVEGGEKPDPEVVDGQPGDLHDQLQEAANYHLPTHYRCGAHTVNLIATTDVKEVRGWNYGPGAAFTKAAGKAQATWNLQNRSPVWANQIKAKTGHKLKTFCVTRWNSYYEAVKSLLKTMVTQDKMDELNTILAQQKGCVQFEIIDKQVLSEYAKVMEPVARCLSKLQGEENAYMGTLLPSLQLMRIALEELQADKTLQYAQPLVTALLGSKESGRGFYGRFSWVFEDDKIIMSSALHPHYTLALIHHFLPDKAAYIKDRIIREMKAIVGMEEEVQSPARSMINKEQDEFAGILAAAPQVRCKEEVEEVIKRELEGWQREMTSIPISPDKFPSVYRDAWLDLFRRYNTPLPSSAAVERLFSSAGDILKPKRSSLSNLNFESLVFLSGNFNLLGFKEWPKEEEEKEGEEGLYV